VKILFRGRVVPSLLPVVVSDTVSAIQPRYYASLVRLRGRTMRITNRGSTCSHSQKRNRERPYDCENPTTSHHMPPFQSFSLFSC